MLLVTLSMTQPSNMFNAQYKVYLRSTTVTCNNLTAAFHLDFRLI